MVLVCLYYDSLTITDQEQNRKQKLRLLTNLGWKLYLVFRKGQYQATTISGFFDLIFVVNDIDIASYADGKTPYIIADNVNDLTTSFALASNALFEWFKNNLLESNIDKCHSLFSKNNRASINVAGTA